MAAGGWALWHGPLHRGTAILRNAGAQSSLAEPEQGQRKPLLTGAAPATGTTIEPDSGVPHPLPGKVHTIPGLPPVWLENAADLGWRKRLDTVTNRPDFSDTLKARSLMEMLPRLPEQATAEATQEAVARLPDADYLAIIRTTLIDPNTDNRVIAVLFADLMDRPA
ncbi:MAG: hypothetical protein ABIP20_09675, partial [Chthoniobacteraceae bacterium]